MPAGQRPDPEHARLLAELAGALDALLEYQAARRPPDVRLVRAEPSALLPLAAVAGRLGVSETTVDRLIEAGRLEVRHEGRRKLVPSRSVDAYVETGSGRRAGGATDAQSRTKRARSAI